MIFDLDTRQDSSSCSAGSENTDEKADLNEKLQITNTSRDVVGATSSDGFSSLILI